MKRPTDSTGEPSHEDVGTPVPNSKYLRAYCHSCKEPIRVTRALNSDGDPIVHICDSCSNKSGTGKQSDGIRFGDLDGFQII